MKLNYTFLVGLLCGVRIYLVLCDEIRQTAFVVVMRCKAETPIYGSMMNGTIPHCAKECAHTHLCKGFNFEKKSGNCHFFKDIRSQKGFMTYSDTDSVVHTKKAQLQPFKVVLVVRAGSGQSVVDLWTGAEPALPGNVRQAFLGCWDRLGVQQVIILLKDSEGAILRRLHFDGHGSRIDNWFTPSRYLSGYVPNNAVINRFAMSGEHIRNFFINQNDDGCGNNAGWLVVLDPLSATKDPCAWGKNRSYPAFLSSVDSDPIIWNNADEVVQPVRMDIIIKTTLLIN